MMLQNIQGGKGSGKNVILQATRGKGVGGEGRDRLGRVKGVVRERRNVTDIARGMGSVGRDVILQRVHGGNGSFGRDMMLQTVQGERVGGQDVMLQT